MRRARVAVREKSAGEIDISPLIDMVFILLIFFIVTTVFVDERGLEAQTPSPDPRPRSDVEPIAFVLTETGAVYFRDREIGFAGVASALRRERIDSKTAVSIEVASDVRTDSMVRLLDLCHGAGAGTVSLKAASR